MKSVSFSAEAYVEFKDLVDAAQLIAQFLPGFLAHGVARLIAFIDHSGSGFHQHPSPGRESLRYSTWLAGKRG
jgi:hypothetical protein